jgi:uncharacterized protein
MQEKYPQLRIKIWTLKYSIISLSGWFLYLFGYEFFFRGILLYTCFRAFGFWPALIINIILYAIVHIDQGAGLSLGSIPMGILLCMITLLTGSFLFAFIIHFWMAMNNEIFSIYNNPDLMFSIRIKGRGE